MSSTLIQYARGVLRRRGPPCSRPPWGSGGGGGAGRPRGISGGGGGGGHKDGIRQAKEMTPEQMEELSVFNAVGGLGLAAVGGIGVFVIGATATLGVASAAAAVLGHTMNSNSIPADPPIPGADLSREDLLAELASLRRDASSKEGDVAKAEIKKQLKATGGK